MSVALDDDASPEVKDDYDEAFETESADEELSAGKTCTYTTYFCEL